jgi:crotonobetainyl-CoA:carnitine CoA-transferase CaiB-like acyl-CoA transferase
MNETSIRQVSSMQKRAAPLEGVRVLELGRLIAAPFCGQILGDLGADVIKIERAGMGDDIRGYGPPFLHNDATPGGASSSYLSYNRNKRSIAIDFSRPEGADLVRSLAAKSDVFIENYKVGSLKKYGLDEPSIRRLRENIVYLSVSGFGQQGPYAGRPATDVAVQGMSGIMSITGEADGPPNKVGVPVADMTTGLYGAVAVIASLYRIAKTGAPGNWVGTSLFDCALSLMEVPAVWSQLCGSPPLRVGNDALGSAPSGVFACRDGDLLLQAGKDDDFVKLCRVLDLKALAEDPRFAQRAKRVTNFEELRPLLVAAIAKWDRHRLYTALIEAGLICGPINTIDEALAEPQAIANGVHQPAGHPEDPSLKLIASPIRFGEDAPGIRRYPPRLAEHTASVLTEILGLGPEKLRQLEKDGVIGLRP